MDKETKRALLTEILTPKGALFRINIPEAVDKIMALDNLNPEEIEAKTTARKMEELTNYETEVAKAEALIAERTPKIEELRRVVSLKVAPITEEPLN